MKKKIVSILVVMSLLTGCSLDFNVGKTETEENEEDVTEAEEGNSTESEYAESSLKGRGVLSQGSLQADEDVEEESDSTDVIMQEEVVIIEETVEEEEEKEPGDASGAKIWAPVDLNVYDSEGNVVGVFYAGESTKVISEKDEYFQIETGYVNSDYVFINLPDYLCDYVEYDITNSYSSIFTVHNNWIDSISGEVIEGYEDVCIDNGEYYVPLLYPVAQQLFLAAKVAEEYGYSLRVYDAYRPYEATRYLYDTMNQLLYSAANEDETFYEVMTDNGAYKISAFLAQYTSAHNYGVALDLTLVDNETGDAVKMQTSMHDLSYYSVTSSNNEYADLLAEIMVACEFDTLSSEWWHFQSDEWMQNLKNAGMVVSELSLDY